jgi:SAM-dependent methyltransferase
MSERDAGETSAGLRFDFGKNWREFLKCLNDERIRAAEDGLKAMLEVGRLDGKTFLDIGSGSGLFSLAARRLGARVHSFDYDRRAVACTEELKQRYFPGDMDWQVEQGDVLDEQYIRSLGRFDIVYAWGVLHHTGAMWRALELAAVPVASCGKLYISIYNDQGYQSVRWRRIKRLYNVLPPVLRAFVLAFCFVRLWGRTILHDLLHGNPLRTWNNYYHTRGMSPWRDVVDWVGGYPFEVAKPEEVFDFYRKRGFTLLRLITCGGGHGCNQYVFRKDA